MHRHHSSLQSRANPCLLDTVSSTEELISSQSRFGPREVMQQL
uniref:Uncharacterized protein n=1 Tax=Arundo donax TaxID=35708 RepID=A0A0A9HFP3_ARUDO